MKYLLDTDILIYFLKGRKEVLTAFDRVTEDDLATSIVNHTELFYGAFNSDRKAQNLKQIEKLFHYLPILKYDEKSSIVFGQLKADLRRAGIPMMDFDLMIAAIALSHQLILVTNNQKHFERVPNLVLENWSISADPT